ncbi:histidine phosphotransferase [Seohaeicola saemankumensis]|nr:histidine phosphotransferase family protein [Seohaeicola saemankumensis]MCA0873340.1 histidine phosphotransferase [Seohaeicola saemankumensis]
MGDINAKLASLIGSRICHDLISPIGAITNGLELLDMTGAVHGPEMELIADSVGNAGARIRFFRIAYGAAGDQTLGQQEINAVLRDIGRGSRTRVTWLPESYLPRAEVRLAFLAVQCCETALPYGGLIEVACEEGENGSRAWAIRAKGEKLNIDDTLWQALNAPDCADQITPAQVQFALLPVLAADLDRAAISRWNEQELSIRF